MNLIENKKAELERLQREIVLLETVEQDNEAVANALTTSYEIQTKEKLSGKDAQRLINALSIVTKRLVTLEAQNITPEIAKVIEKTEQKERSGGLYMRRNEFCAWILSQHGKTNTEIVKIFKAKREQDLKDGLKPMVSSALYTESKLPELFNAIQASGQLDKWIVKDQEKVEAALRLAGLI